MEIGNQPEREFAFEIQNIRKTKYLKEIHKCSLFRMGAMKIMNNSFLPLLHNVARKHCNIIQISWRLKHWYICKVCSGRIAESTAACYYRFNPFRSWAAVKQVFILSSNRILNLNYQRSIYVYMVLLCQVISGWIALAPIPTKLPWDILWS
jgi:hypothetical protein